MNCKIGKIPKKYIFTIHSFILLVLVACASQSPLQEYIQNHPELPAEKVIAMQNLQVLNGMTMEEVSLMLGKPNHIEQRENGTQRWIYREKSMGMRREEAYSNPNSFPSGMGVVVPLHYRSRQIYIDFDAGKVCQVEQILNF